MLYNILYGIACKSQTWKASCFYDIRIIPSLASLMPFVPITTLEFTSLAQFPYRYVRFTLLAFVS